MITRTVKKMNLSHSGEAFFNCKTMDMLKLNVQGKLTSSKLRATTSITKL